MSKKEKTDKLAPTAHDALFKKVMTNQVAAQEFLEEYLSENMKQFVDISSVKIEQESYVDDELKKSLSDIVYSVKTRDNEKAFVYVLIEAQSTVDYWVAFRLWKYMLALAERHKNEKKDKLPLVIPVVFYNGKQKYNAPRNLWELFQEPEMAKKLMSEDYKLIDLQSMSDDDIRKKKHLGVIEYFMRNIHARNMLEIWEKFFDNFQGLLAVDRERDCMYIKLALWYTETKMSVDGQEKLSELIKKQLPEGEDIMKTIAQVYIEEGREEEKKETVVKMIREGLAMDLIIRLSGLSEFEIQKIKNTLNKR